MWYCLKTYLHACTGCCESKRGAAREKIESTPYIRARYGRVGRSHDAAATKNVRYIYWKSFAAARLPNKPPPRFPSFVYSGEGAPSPPPSPASSCRAVLRAFIPSPPRTPSVSHSCPPSPTPRHPSSVCRLEGAATGPCGAGARSAAPPSLRPWPCRQCARQGLSAPVNVQEIYNLRVQVPSPACRDCLNPAVTLVNVVTPWLPRAAVASSRLFSRRGAEGGLLRASG